MILNIESITIDRSKRLKNEYEKLSILLVYFVVLFYIALFSREAGSRMGTNMSIGGTWTVDPQGRAYVVENILLFVPFGILIRGCFMRLKLLGSICAGFVLSIIIECLQLATSRGFFQIDDMIMNTAGSLMGALVISFVIYIITSIK